MVQDLEIPLEHKSVTAKKKKKNRKEKVLRFSPLCPAQEKVIFRLLAWIQFFKNNHLPKDDKATQLPLDSDLIWFENVHAFMIITIQIKNEKPGQRFFIFCLNMTSHCLQIQLYLTPHHGKGSIKPCGLGSSRESRGQIFLSIKCTLTAQRPKAPQYKALIV